ncbi:hypothetical protein LZZ85_27265 [Terrimonas sp. NA20]|uniref:Uncharacterized protein n=1 Tax=Terrimonas ginsenosidimutans TaxID=2908004 RepID=A0ABS9L0C4_9BACT|nr:hypothetical protein [Terrimonas ginsenosidimutans]MCG2618033.1 hypothetical protein [Terrimonas ginsenosidimutans]
MSTFLFLSRSNLCSADKSANILEIIPKEALAELGDISSELLKTAGLAEMNEKLKSF